MVIEQARYVLFSFFLLVIVCLSGCGDSEGSVVYTASDGSFTVEYPNGWIARGSQQREGKIGTLHSFIPKRQTRLGLGVAVLEKGLSEDARHRINITDKSAKQAIINIFVKNLELKPKLTVAQERRSGTALRCYASNPPFSHEKAILEAYVSGDRLFVLTALTIDPHGLEEPSVSHFFESFD